MKTLRTEHFTKIENFRDSFFDQNYPDRYVKLFERFARNRDNLKLACIIAYLQALNDDCLYLVYTGAYVRNGCVDAGYCFHKIENPNDVLLKEDIVKQIVSSTNYHVFSSIKGYIVDQQGSVEKLINFDQYILS